MNDCALQSAVLIPLNMEVQSAVKLIISHKKKGIGRLKVCTLEYLIAEHAHLIIFQKISVLCLLIRSCSFNYFLQISNPVRLFHPVRLFFSEKKLTCVQKSIFLFSATKGFVTHFLKYHDILYILISIILTFYACSLIKSCVHIKS